MQEFQPLRRQFTADKVDACRVAARPWDASDEPELDWVFGEDEDNGDRRGRRLGCKRRSVAACDDYRNLSANQFERQLLQPVVFALGPAVFDRNVFALDKAGLLQALTKSSHTF